MEILEGAASMLGGFGLESYRKRYRLPFKLTVREALAGAELILSDLQPSAIPPSLALSALARPRLSHAERRKAGVYYTDFRLAQYVATDAVTHLVRGARIIDPAAGSGILLVAATLAACGSDQRRRARWLAESVTAVDRAPDAIRGARLALASLTDDLEVINEMVSRWRCQDSLLAELFKPHSFDIVVGNPPWEKIKLSRHEFLNANGGSRHYGDEYGLLDAHRFSEQRSIVAKYGTVLETRYHLLGSGEPDLYKAFLELFLRLVRPGGRISVLVPAGLIRSQGTESLRRFLLEHSAELSL